MKKLLLALLLPLTAHAMPIEHGSYTTSGGLEWRDVNLTAGLSYAQVMESTSTVGNDLYRMRHATSSELDELLADFRLPFGGFGDSNPIELKPGYLAKYEKLRDAIVMLGAHSTTCWSEIDSPDCIAYQIEGRLADTDRYSPDGEPHASFWSAIVMWSSLYADAEGSNSGTTSGTSPELLDNINWYSPLVGHFLVRDVPEPASLGLVGLALAALGVSRRRTAS